MENEFFLNAGIPPPFSTWQSLSSALEIQTPELNCSSQHSPDYFFHNPNWDKSNDHRNNNNNIHFDSALSSMVSSPAASNSNISNESFVIRELIGKLGNIGNSGEISSNSQPLLVAPAPGNKSCSTSCYSTPLNSPPKHKCPMNSTVAEFSADPGFAERAARFSCFGSKSFNGRIINTGEFSHGFKSPMQNEHLPRVSSSPSLNALGSQIGVHQIHKNFPVHDPIDLSNSQEHSTLSEQNPHGETCLKALNDLNSKKRKSNSRVVAKKPASSPSQNATKVFEENEHSNAKRCKAIEGNESEKGDVKTKEEPTNAGDDKQNKMNQKSPEPPKDYIHVRARRGQATDSHSLAERVRREKISERMKLLQDLVPGCNKVTGKALMLDEIINYVQSLQRQVEFLSMKLSSVNTKLYVDTQISKEVFQSNNSLQDHHPMYPIDSSASAFLGHQNSALHSNNANGKLTNFSVDPLDSQLHKNLMHLPHLDGFNENAHQYPIFTQGDLQTIVQMGLGQNLNQDMKNFLGSNQNSRAKLEL